MLSCIKHVQGYIMKNFDPMLGITVSMFDKTNYFNFYERYKTLQSICFLYSTVDSQQVFFFVNLEGIGKTPNL